MPTERDLIDRMNRAVDEFTRTSHDNAERIRQLENAVARDYPPRVRSPHGDTLTEATAQLIYNFAAKGIQAELQTSDGSKGGHLAPPDYSGDVDRKIRDGAPMMQDVTSPEFQGSRYEHAVNENNATAVWVGEGTGPGETAPGDISVAAIDMHEVAAEPAVTQKLADTSPYQVIELVAQNVADAFAAVWQDAVLNGDGVAKPRGLLTYTLSTLGDATRSIREVQRLNTGASGAFAAAPNGGDVLFDVIAALNSGYRSGASWIMNSATEAAVRKLKDSQGQYQWQQALIPGQPNTLCGYPVRIVEQMPTLAASSLSVAFGNWRRAYVAPRGAMSFLRDPYTSKGKVKLYHYRRYGGGVVNTQAYKILQFS